MTHATSRRLKGEASAYFLAVLGAVVAWSLGLPLAFLIGPLIVLTIMAQRWPQLQVSRPVYAVALMVVAVALGQYFNPDVVSTWREIAATLVMNAGMTLVGLFVGYHFLLRVFGYDPATAIFSGLPGGILTVMEVSRESDADAGAVLFFQVFRIVLGATSIPMLFALAGFDIPSAAVQQNSQAHPATLHDILFLVPGTLVLAVLGRKLRFPSAEISLPLIWSAILYGSGTVTMSIPVWLPAIGFIVVGAAVGTLLPRPSVSTLIRLVLHTTALFILFMALTIFVALLARHALGIGFATGVLTFSPASLTEMIAVSVALNLDPAMIAANNLFRMIFCSILAPILLIGLKQKARKTRA